jgi:dihydropyrimidinase
MGSLTVKNCLLVRPTGTSAASIHTDGGVVRAILPADDAPAADVMIDAEGRFVIPGVIDNHVHLGLSQSFEDACRRESAAAVTGGVTSMMHFLLSSGSFFDVYDEHVKAIETNSLIDIGFHALVLNDTQVAEIPKTVDELGLTSYKFHMAMKGPEAAYGIRGVDDGALYEGLLQVATRPGVMAGTG